MRRRKKFDWRTFWLFVFLSTFIGNRRYKGDRSHLKGAGGFFVDLLCILCLTPLAVMLVNHYEKRDMKSPARQEKYSFYPPLDDHTATAKEEAARMPAGYPITLGGKKTDF